MEGGKAFLCNNHPFQVPLFSGLLREPRSQRDAWLAPNVADVNGLKMTLWRVVALQCQSTVMPQQPRVVGQEVAVEGNKHAEHRPM